MSSGYEERHQAQTVSQIREYMKKLNRLQQEHKSLATHVALAERLQQLTREPRFHRRLECEQEALGSGGCSAEAEAYLEDLIADGEPLPSVLRLLCLLSAVSNGLKPKSLAHLQVRAPRRAERRAPVAPLVSRASPGARTLDARSPSGARARTPPAGGGDPRLRFRPPRAHVGLALAARAAQEGRGAHAVALAQEVAPPRRRQHARA